MSSTRSRPRPPRPGVLRSQGVTLGAWFGTSPAWHEREDEACYVIEGDITLFIGEDTLSVTGGRWIYLPRRIPHSLRIDFDEARMVRLIVPGGFDSFFVELFPRAGNGTVAEADRPDVERMVTTGARSGVTIGPMPDK